MTDRFHIVVSERRVADLQHLLRGDVHQLQSSCLVDDNDALNHPGENRGHPPAIALEVRQSVPELMDRVVKGPRHDAEFVVSVIESWRREVALTVPLRDPGNGANALAHPPGKDARGDGSAKQCEPERGECGQEDAGQLLPDAGQRQRNPQERHRRPTSGDRHVEHLLAQGGAGPS